MAQRCLAFRAKHRPRRTTPTPFPNLSSALSTKKVAPTTGWPKPKPSVLWPAIEGHVSVVGSQRKTRGTGCSGSSNQELGRVGKLPFPLEFNTGEAFSASPLAFLLHCIPTCRPATTTALQATLADPIFPAYSFS